MIKICKCCGTEYESTQHNRIYCSKKCTIKMSDSFKRERKLREKSKMKTIANSLADWQREAEAHGMSYGQYVAQMTR